VGACLLGTWGLPLPILEAIYWHHCPERSPDTAFSLLTAVHVADVFAQESGCASVDAKTCDCINLGYLAHLDLVDRRNSWRRLCSIEVKPEEEPAAERHRRRREAKEN
jgi:hypothetical protein